MKTIEVLECMLLNMELTADQFNAISDAIEVLKRQADEGQYIDQNGRLWRHDG